MTRHEIAAGAPFTVIGVHAAERTVAICQPEKNGARLELSYVSPRGRGARDSARLHVYARVRADAGESAHVAPGLINVLVIR